MKDDTILDPVKAKRLSESMKVLYGRSIHLKEEIRGFTPPSSLITDLSYPKVFLGILLSESDRIEYYDNPIFWAKEERRIEDIIRYRSSLINARTISDVYLPRKKSRLYDSILESCLSIKSVDLEVELRKVREAKFIPRVHPFYGFIGSLRNLKVIENPKVPRKVEDINDLKAEEAVYYIYKEGFSDYYISRIFSLGYFGLNHNRKLVPSKWAITAVQSIIERNIRREYFQRSKIVDYIYIFNYKFYGNDFYGILMPGNGEVELIEAILPGSAYSINNKLIIGRDKESGGYYSLRLSFAEFVKDTGLLGNLIVFRIITDEYKIPLGVWVVREGVKKMFFNNLARSSSLYEALSFINSKLIKYNLSIYKLIKYSDLYKQKKITSFI
ncbi:hypothetical protein BA065_01585 [Nanoarchaeota archaeon NZ13-N]|nr:MAG: hypothetical protein BA065_01585 [Nanoarchaeota archaeon NZ13-N]